MSYNTAEDEAVRTPLLNTEDTDMEGIYEGGEREQAPEPRGYQNEVAETVAASSAQDARPPSPADSSETLKYGAKHVIKIFVPVTLCMTIVVATMVSIPRYHHKTGEVLPYAPFDNPDADTGTKFLDTLKNVLIMLAAIVVATVLIVLLYKFRCYIILRLWLIVASLLLLFLFTYMYLFEVINAYAVPVDYITVAIIVWNVGVAGMFAIHWKGPLLLQQAYLIFTSALIALLFIRYFPNWTVWGLLALIAVWDLVAVLCPMGPLRILVETAHERNETLFPALIYSSAVMYMMVHGNKQDEEQNKADDSGSHTTFTTAVTGADNEPDVVPSTSADTAPRNVQRTQPQPRSRGPQLAQPEECEGEPGTQDRVASTSSLMRATQAVAALNNAARQPAPPEPEDDEERGVKLGLGDFIFYSLLVGTASTIGDWNTTLACFIAILIGLCFTLLLLAIFHKALPALPISIAFGLVFYFLTSLVVRPFMDRLASAQVYI